MNDAARSSHEMTVLTISLRFPIFTHQPASSAHITVNDTVRGGYKIMALSISTTTQCEPGPH